MQIAGYPGSSGYSTRLNRNNVQFGEAQINILASSDNHGKFEPLPAFYSKIIENLNTIFPDKDKRGILNVNAIVGDWFFNAPKKGFKTDPTKSLGDYQLIFLNKLISSLKKNVPNLESLYVPGNHCFEGGDRQLFDYLAKADMTTVLSNTKLNESPVFNDLTSEEQEKIQESYILEVPDDKNSEKIHKTLVLGVTIPGVDFYTPGLVNDLNIIDRSNKNEVKTNDDDLKQTYRALDSTIREFKKDNPQGAVILMSHTGIKISEMIARNVANIDVILNGHDHKDEKIAIKKGNNKKTHIICLGQDSNKFDTVKLHFSDDGYLDKLTDNSFRTYYVQNRDNKNILQKIKDVFSSIYDKNPLTQLIKECFKEDMKPSVYISGPREFTSLSQKGVRYENNLLANFVTDGILESIKKYEPDTQIFGVASSAFRQDLPINEWTNNLELMNVLNGSIENLSKLYVGNVSGNDIADIVLENVADNLKNPDRNTINQWSGLQIDKIGLTEIIRSGKREDVEQYIRVKDESGKYHPINPNENYKVALPNKFFVRPNIKTVKYLESKFVPIDKTMNEVFMEYIQDNNNRVGVPQDIRIIS